MVHTWLLRRGLRKLLTGLILFLIGFVVFTYLMGQPIKIPISFYYPNNLNPLLEEELTPFAIEFTARKGTVIGAIGVISAITGVGYLLVTVVLEYRKKGRYAHRSKI